MKNVIVIPTYNSLLENENYSKCIDTWKFYCNKYDIELYLIQGEKSYKEVKNDYAAMCFDRWLDVDFSPEQYDRVTFVDADTIIRWDAYDFNSFFKQYNLDIVVVHDQGGPGIPEYHFNQWLQFNPEIYSFVKGYFNAGFVSMKAKHLIEIKKALIPYKEYYYSEKDINTHVEGIGKEGGVRLDAMDQTAINLVIQSLYPDNIAFVNKTFNCQVPYLYGGNEAFGENYHSFEFLNKGMIFHLGSTTLAYTNFINDFWNTFKEKYQ
jgi:hypothetical protein